MKTQFTCVQIYLCIRINLKVLINYLRINLCTDQLVYGLSCARIILGTDQLTGTDQLIYGSTMTTGSGLELNPGSSPCRKCLKRCCSGRCCAPSHPQPPTRPSRIFQEIAVSEHGGIFLKQKMKPNFFTFFSKLMQKFWFFETIMKRFFDSDVKRLNLEFDFDFTFASDFPSHMNRMARFDAIKLFFRALKTTRSIEASLTNIPSNLNPWWK